jgi:hypothetical protein
VTIACAVSAPIAAYGDAGHRAAAADAALERALAVRAQVADVNEQAREDAPAAVGSHCDATLDVDGIGDTCVTSNGLLRVEQADGRSATIHGVDAPPLEAGAFAPSSQTAVTGADVSDITCAAPDQPHYVLLYARPGNVASRFDTIAPQLRDEVYKVSAYIDAEARSITPDASRKVPLRCEGGQPVVLQATLGTLLNGSASFGQIVDALRAQGYEFNNDKTGLERYVVYYDSASPTGAAGTGHVFTQDSRGDATNQNNNGGLYSIEYNFAGGGAVPHWEVLIHELLHTMGAVVASAPNASSAGHCIDGQDIMCYQDAQTTPYNPSVCATKVLDCGRNDYFNPSPAAGSFLATHWNAAATYNRFLVASTATGGDPETRTPNGADVDVTPPVAPSALRVRQVGGSLRFSWGAASDDRGVSRYELRRVGTTRASGSTSSTALTITTAGLRVGTVQAFEVVARDAAANASPAARVSLRIARDLVRPTAPTRLRVVARSRSSLTLTWNASRDEAGIRSYVLAQRVGTRWVTLQTLGAGTRTVRVVGLRAHSPYTFRVVATDPSRNQSLPSRSLATRTS